MPKPRNLVPRNECYFITTKYNKFLIFQYGNLLKIDCYSLKIAGLKVGSLYIDRELYRRKIVVVQKITRSFDKVTAIAFFTLVADLQNHAGMEQELKVVDSNPSRKEKKNLKIG